MSNLSAADLKKPDNTGVGTSRAAVLYKVIKEGTPIQLVSGGKKALQAKGNDVLKALELAADTLDDGAHDKVSKLFLRKKPLKIVGSKTDIGLSDIEKTEMFGGGKGKGGGATGTAIQESAAAWFAAVRFSMNKPLTQEPSDAQFAAVADRVETDKSLDDIKNFLEENPAWVDSCMATANELYRKFGKKNGYNWYRGGSLVRSISDHFKKVNASYEKPPFSNLNKWSPADIWACECSFDKGEMRETTTFSSFNAYLKKAIDDQILYGISLKKNPTSSMKVSEVNYTKSRPSFAFKTIYAKSFESLDMWMYINDGLEVQFRDTSGGDTLSWQGEAIGTYAKHGKIGGGVINLLCQQVYGSPLYNNLDNIKTQARSGALNVPILRLSQSHLANIDGSMNTEGRTKISEITADIIKEQYEKSDPKGQWSFSKYMGLLLIDKLMSGSADQFAQLVYLYATSQSRESAPFYKVS